MVLFQDGLEIMGFVVIGQQRRLAFQLGCVMKISDMKQIIFSALAILGMCSFISCERHTWEDSSDGAKDGTKRLFPKPACHDTHVEHVSQNQKLTR